MKRRKTGGFSLVELLISVIIVGLLAAVAMPNFLSSMQNAETASVKGSMRTVQIAVEDYLCASGGEYPIDCTSGAQGCGPFFPGGGNVIGGSTGTYPVNTVTGAQAVAPCTLGLTDTQSMQNLRAEQACGRNFPSGSGAVSYDQLDGGNSYAVCGGDARGNFVAGTTGQILVISNN